MGVIDFLQSYSHLYYNIIINIGLALSLYITLKAGQLTMGHAGFMAIGAYTAALLTTKLGAPFLPSLVAGGLLSGIIGLLIGFPVLRLKGVYLAIATLALGELVRFIILNWSYTGQAMGLNGISTHTKFYHIVIFIVILVYLFHILENTQYGRALMAIGEDEMAVKTIGLNTTFYKVFAFTIGACIAGLAGGLFAHYSRIISPGEFGFSHAVSVLLFVIFGGTRNYWGPILGALFLTVLPEVFRFLADYRLIVYGLCLLLVIIFLPSGLISLLPQRKRMESVRQRQETTAGNGGVI